MFDLLTLKKYDDFFKPQSQRTGKGVFFYRFIGYDEEVLNFLKLYLKEAEKLGAYINNGFENPTESEVKYFYNVTDEKFILSKEHITENTKKWLLGIPKSNLNLLSNSIFDFFSDMQGSGVNINIIKNAYIKFMCWIKKYFVKTIFALGLDEVPKILYDCELSKYELYMLRVLSKSGCDIVYVNYISEDSYKQIDKDSKFSMAIYGKEKKNPGKNFSLNVEVENSVKNQPNSKSLGEQKVSTNKFKNLENIINTNDWINGEFWDSILLKNSERNSDRNRINNIFIEYLGFNDENEYSEILFNLYNNLNKSKKPHVLIEDKMHNPTVDEVNAINKLNINLNSADSISNILNVELNDKIKLFFIKSFLDVINSEDFVNSAALKNFGLKMIIWIIRYCKKMFENFDFENIPSIIYFGNATEQEAIFLNLISKTPMDVLYICPNKEVENPFLSLKVKSNILLKEMENSKDNMVFPKNSFKQSASTVAYKAENELKTLIYTDTGLYKERQFSKSSPLTLKTSYDEIFIIWKEEAKYRPHFNVDDKIVTVPNIFAKICGVENGNLSEYFKKIKTMITTDTILISKFPFIDEKKENNIKPYAYKFLNKKQLKINDIKKHSKYFYDFLSDEKQNYILEKIQELIDLDLIEADTMGIENLILGTLLNLDNQTLRLIQQFDFTKNIPKLIIIDTNESVASLEDAIYISFLNLIGFDIAVFTPTGYRNIEKHIKESAFQKYDIGDLMFDIIQPNKNWFLSNDNLDKGIFNRIFGKGRK